MAGSMFSKFLLSVIMKKVIGQPARIYSTTFCTLGRKTLLALFCHDYFSKNQLVLFFLFSS